MLYWANPYSHPVSDSANERAWHCSHVDTTYMHIHVDPRLRRRLVDRVFFLPPCLSVRMYLHVQSFVPTSGWCKLFPVLRGLVWYSFRTSVINFLVQSNHIYFQVPIFVRHSFTFPLFPSMHPAWLESLSCQLSFDTFEFANVFLPRLEIFVIKKKKMAQTSTK